MGFMIKNYDYLELILQSPKLFPIDFKIYRRTVLKRFSKYVIIYSFADNEIFVLPVFQYFPKSE